MAVAALRLGPRAVAAAMRGGAGCSATSLLGLRAHRAGGAVAARTISSAAAGKVCTVIAAELKHEQENYEQAKEIKSFLGSTPFKLVDTPGSVNMALEREVKGKSVRIEWQLMPPFTPEGDAGGEDVEDHETTELSVFVEDKSSGAGLIFYCSTQTGEEHRYVIGNVKSYASAEERDGPSSYNGPDFEDLDEKLQENLDELLAELGMSSEVCDFVDRMAVDKEQREYVRWLQSAKKFLEE